MTKVGTDPTDENLRAWFPLVQRPRPPGLPLEDRVRHLQDLAARTANGIPLVRAAEVCNKAALIASDCGQPDLAQDLCWRQHTLFDQARPLPASAAELALQPVLNLPRQQIRDGDGNRAYAILQTLYEAALTQTSALIDGRSVSLHNVTCAPDDHRTMRTLTWTALLADGVRALARAGRWHEAAERAAAHRGVGRRLLDGRQATVLALAQAGHTEQAAELVDQSTTPEPWEQAVQTILRVYCLRQAGADTGPQIAPLVTTALILMRQPDPSTRVFRARAGMITLNLADGHDHPRIDSLRQALIAGAFDDAYTARDTLAHRLRESMTTAQRHALTDVIYAAGLDAGGLPEALYGDLMDTVNSAEDQLRGHLIHHTRRCECTTTTS
ncbi:hypothetical protein [Parafrankia sp. EUN1f]|uniref:hypothetical protein n=1 Tax=Parafrankia sp. EUN1f TaxID=102897 RepID=UPI0001C43F13|nr:hypothetical protein [Parafrankia sp. EUN1f]EFC83506.1 hypothetical protein FrEUN1fDRAFT_3405 [Parafrankia sp. EUN1f]